MFDRTLNVIAPRGNSGPSHVTVTVTEKRAPTDASVKLLREMEEKAHQSVINSIQVGDTHFEARLVVNRLPATEGGIEFHIIYSLNGKKMETIYRPDWREQDVTKQIEGLIDAVAKDVSREIISASLANIRHLFS